MQLASRLLGDCRNGRDRDIYLSVYSGILRTNGRVLGCSRRDDDECCGRNGDRKLTYYFQFIPPLLRALFHHTGLRPASLDESDGERLLSIYCGH